MSRWNCLHLIVSSALYFVRRLHDGDLASGMMIPRGETLPFHSSWSHFYVFIFFSLHNVADFFFIRFFSPCSQIKVQNVIIKRCYVWKNIVKFNWVFRYGQLKQTLNKNIQKTQIIKPQMQRQWGTRTALKKDFPLVCFRRTFHGLNWMFNAVLM